MDDRRISVEDSAFASKIAWKLYNLIYEVQFYSIVDFLHYVFSTKGIFSSNSEANDSEFLDDIEEMYSVEHGQIPVWNFLSTPPPQPPPTLRFEM